MYKKPVIDTKVMDYFTAPAADFARQISVSYDLTELHLFCVPEIDSWNAIC
jgi:hypothetical protein